MAFQVHARLCVACKRVLVRTNPREAWSPFQGTLSELGYKHRIISVQDFECSKCLTETLQRVATTAGETH